MDSISLYSFLMSQDFGTCNEVQSQQFDINKNIGSTKSSWEHRKNASLSFTRVLRFRKGIREENLSSAPKKSYVSHPQFFSFVDEESPSQGSLHECKQFRAVFAPSVAVIAISRY